MNKNLKQELDWIDSHPKFYKSKEHQEIVKQNLVINYGIRELQGRLNTLRNVDVRNLELEIQALKEKLLPVDLNYVSVKVPPIPKTTTEVAEEAKQNEPLSLL